MSDSRGQFHIEHWTCPVCGEHWVSVYSGDARTCGACKKREDTAKIAAFDEIAKIWLKDEPEWLDQRVGEIVRHYRERAAVGHDGDIP